MKRCPIAAIIARSIGILPCCALNNFFSHRGMNVCLIVRLLLATILCIWEICSPRIQCITYFPAGQKRGQKARPRTDFQADRWPENEYFFGGPTSFRGLFTEKCTDNFGSKFKSSMFLYFPFTFCLDFRWKLFRFSFAKHMSLLRE